MKIKTEEKKKKKVQFLKWANYTERGVSKFANSLCQPLGVA